MIDKEIHRITQKKFADKNRNYYRNKNKIHNLKNKLNGYASKKQKEYAKRNPEKIKAHNFANRTKQKGNKCKMCSTKKNLEFHHTNYKKNQGITICKGHHEKC